MFEYQMNTPPPVVRVAYVAMGVMPIIRVPQMLLETIRLTG